MIVKAVYDVDPGRSNARALVRATIVSESTKIADS